MSLSYITKRNKKIFEEQFNRKSNYFRKLPNKKYEGLKKIEEDKIDLVIDKILGIGEFKRDYSMFSNPPNKLRKSTENKNLNKNVRYKLESMLEKDFEKKRQNKRFDDLGDIDKKEYESEARKFKNVKIYRTLTFKNDTTQPQQNNSPTFFTSIGNNIIVSNQEK